MKCPACQHDNPAGAKFCEQCATALSSAPPCPNCGWQVQSTANFCPQCGNALKAASDDSRFASPTHYTPQRLAEKILISKSALEGERKQITVLFADIKGSMELLADRDPEDAQKLLDPVLDLMIEAVHRYEGTVNRVMGDGIMALFGAPLSHEDHAVRACYAALRMQETVNRYADEVHRLHGVPVTIRVGLNSGEIVIRAIGNDLHMDYTVVGQTAHLASRMEQMAKPGSVLTTADTVKLAEGYIVTKRLGAVPVKGMAGLVEVFEVTGAGTARTRLQAAARHGLTHFVGRDLELEQLRRGLTLASQSRGQVVAIVGEAGVGKSRLVREFIHSTDTAGWRVLESNSVSYGHATPYLPVIELLRHYFMINLDDSPRSIREKVTDKIVSMDASLQDTLPPLLDLLDVLGDDHPFRSLDPQQHRHYTYQAITRLVLAESRTQPIVVVFEDLHWNDTLSLGLLNEMIVEAQGARLLLVVSYRPEYKDEWKSRPNYHQLRLDPLSSESLAGFLLALLGSDSSLPNLKRFLVERASGNPFFAEEIVRSLVDTGVLKGARANYSLARTFSSIDVPPTVRAVLAARIDALPIAEKRLLQEAAVIGYDAPYDLLHEICGLTEDLLRRLLDNLQGAEFLYTTQLFPDLQYTFKHALTHDVTYSGVLHERRRDIHARVVGAIERLHPDRRSEHVERLAHHAHRGELRDKAVHYLRQAGAKAAARSALVDAQECFEVALDVLKALPESRETLEEAFDIRLDLRQVLRQLGEGRPLLDHLREAERLAERLKDDQRRGLVCVFMTTVRSTLDELDEAVETGTRALEIARRLGDLKLRVLATSCLEQAYCYRGDYQHVIDVATDCVEAMPANWLHEHLGLAVPPSVFGRAWLIMSLAELGRFAEAAKYEAEVIQIAEPTQHAFTIGWAHFAASMPHLLRGDWAKASLLVERWIGILRGGNVAIHLPWAVASSAWALAKIGERSESLARIQEGEQLLERQAAKGIVGHCGWAYHALGHASLLLGRLDEAKRLADRAIETSHRQPGFTAHALRLLGDVTAHPGRFNAESAAAYYRQAMVTAERLGMRPLVAHCHFGLGKLHDRAGKRDQAAASLAIATTMYREMGMSFWLDPGEADMVAGGDGAPRVQPVLDVSGPRL